MTCGRILLWSACVALLLFQAAPVGAAEEPPSPTAAAAEVKQAFVERNTARVAELAARDDPDPWLVADALLRLGNRDCALAFARAAPRKDVEKLPAYVESAEEGVAAEHARAAWESAADALEAGKPRDALIPLAGVKTPDSVPGSLLQFVRGRTHAALGQRGEAARAFQASADIARRLGWHAREAEALFHSGLEHNLDARYEEALAAGARRLEVETLLGSTVGIGRAHYGIAVAYEGKGDPESRAREKEHLAKARTHAEQAGDSIYLAKVITNEAHALSRAREHRGALDLAEQALKAFDGRPLEAPPARFRHDPAWVAASKARLLLTCAGWSLLVGNLDRMRACGSRAEKLAIETGDAALAASARGQVALLEGIYDEHFKKEKDELGALDHYESAVTHFRAAGGREALADTLRRAWTIRGGLGDYVGALARLQEALEIFATIDSDLARRRLHNLHMQAVYMCIQVGRTTTAGVHCQSALRLARALKSKAREADALGALARYHRARTEYGQAIARVMEALRRQEETGTVGNRGVLLLGLARLEADVGKVAKALATTQKAVDDLRAQRDASNLRLAYGHLASLRMRQGEHQEAIDILQGLLDEYRTGKQRAHEAAVLARLSNVHSNQGNYSRAAELLEASCGILDELEDLRGGIGAYIQLGRARLQLGQRSEALQALLRARKDAVDLEDPGLLAWSAVALAESHYKLGNWAEALLWADEGVKTTRSLGLDLAEGEGAQARAMFATLPAHGAVAALKLKDLGQMHRFLEEGRAATLLAALGGRKVLREATIPDELREREEAARSAEALATEAHTASRRSRDRIASGKTKKKLDEARGRLREAIDEIERSARLQSDLAYPRITPLEEVQALLGSDEMMVVYSRLLEDCVALVVTKTDKRVVPLGPVAAVRAAAQALLQDDKYVVNETKVGDLRKKIVEPLGLKPTHRRLLISPDGTLGYVPFSFVVEDREVVLVPSTTGYALLRSMEAERTTKAKDVLAFGDPAYDPALARTHPRLEASGGEVRAIGDMIRVQKEASETQFRLEVTEREHWRAVHLACHGFVDAKHPTQSSLELIPDGKNDGRLTALDVFRMKIPADLAVLSACDTGRGKVVEGEGILGLTRAFMFAGSPRVLVSLWKVNDEATGALMKEFYRLWNPRAKPEDPERAPRVEGAKPMSASKALRKAQDFVRSQEKWKHPEYWAAWVLWGLP